MSPRGPTLAEVPAEQLALADRVRRLPPAKRAALYRRLDALGPEALASLRFELEAFFLRPDQVVSRSWRGSLIVFGGPRGDGKTEAALHLWAREILEGRAVRPRLFGANEAHIGQIVVERLLPMLPPHQRPEWVASTKEAPSGLLRFRTVGVTARGFTAKDPEGAVSSEGDLDLYEDAAKWGPTLELAWKHARASCRHRGPAGARGIVATTKRGGYLAQILKGQTAEIRKAPYPRSNRYNLAPGTYERLRQELEGDAFYAQEIDDSDEVAGALWKRAWIDHVPAVPPLERVVVAVDPADDGLQGNDETGIVVLGLGFDGRLYVLADYTALHDATRWPAIVAWAFRFWKCDAIVAEVNRARSLVRRCLSIEAPNVQVQEVDATRAKQTRAEPLAMLYQGGRVSHVLDGPQLSRPGHVWIKVSIFDPATGRREEVEIEVKRDPRRHATLEDELCTWVPRQGRSPNGLDALVWGAWYLRPPDGDTWSATPPVPPALVAEEPYRYQAPPALPFADGWSTPAPVADVAPDPYRYSP